jgi:uncharacterized protein
VAAGADAPHLPRLAPIDAYGNGGFRFAGMSHRGSILCLPVGIWAWPVVRADDIDEAALAPAFADARDFTHFIFGTGKESWIMPDPLRQKFRALGIVVEAMTTGAAVRTYNILLGERRRIAAGLLAVE